MKFYPAFAFHNNTPRRQLGDNSATTRQQLGDYIKDLAVSSTYTIVKMTNLKSYTSSPYVSIQNNIMSLIFVIYTIVSLMKFYPAFAFHNNTPRRQLGDYFGDNSAITLKTSLCHPHTQS